MERTRINAEGKELFASLYAVENILKVYEEKYHRLVDRIPNGWRNFRVAQSNIENADPRRILRQGYVLARGKGGKVVKKASAATAGDDFSLLFDDGEWACRISEVKLKT